MKRTQLITVWLLPLVALGGLAYPYLGLLMVAMMAVMAPLAFFKGRYWCAVLCPRGAFLDLVMARLSAGKPMPRFLVAPGSRLMIFTVFMSVLVVRLFMAGGRAAAVGAVFVALCDVTTILAVILTLISRQRGWCAICPMGFLQEKLGRLGKRRRGSAVTRDG